MEATITIKMTPAEHRLIRSALQAQAQVALTQSRRDSDATLSERRVAASEAVQLQHIIEKL